MNKKILILASLALLIIALVLYLNSSDQLPVQVTKSTAAQVNATASTSTSAISENPTPTPNAPEATSVEQLSCAQIMADQANTYSLTRTLQHPKVSERYHNRHLEYEGEVFRLRSFYDDANEGEQLTFLVYLEDEDEFAHIKERSALSKGVLYLQLEEAIAAQEAQVIYDEVGLTIPTEMDSNGLTGELFMQYKDGKLSGLQGTLGTRHLECLGQ